MCKDEPYQSFTKRVKHVHESSVGTQPEHVSKKDFRYNEASEVSAKSIPISTQFIQQTTSVNMCKEIQKVMLSIQDSIHESHGDCVFTRYGCKAVVYDGGKSLSLKWTVYHHSQEEGYILECRRQHGCVMFFCSVFRSITHILNTKGLLSQTKHTTPPIVATLPKLILPLPEEHIIQEGISRLMETIQSSKHSLPSTPPTIRMKTEGFKTLTTLVCDYPSYQHYFTLDHLTVFVEHIWSEQSDIQRCALCLLVLSCANTTAQQNQQRAEHIAKQLHLSNDTIYYSLTNQCHLQCILTNTHYKKREHARQLKTLLEYIQPYLKYPEHFLDV